MHINPDHFLETSEGRVWTREGNAIAWEKSCAALDAALREGNSRTLLYVLIGCQASGKSTWARAKQASEPEAIIFDGILVKKSERQPILRAAASHKVPAVAVVFETPLQVCLQRNAARSADEIVNEQGLRNVFAARERPEMDEGFAEVIEVRHSEA